MKHSRGLSLIELMATLLVAVVLLTVAVPSFQTLIENNRTATQTNSLVAGLNFARTEAVRRGATLRVSALGDAGEENFNRGWCVHLGNSCSGDDIIRQFPPMRGMVVDTAPQNLAWLAFDDRGAKTDPAANVVLTLLPVDCPDGATARARELEVVNTGRVSVTRIDCPES